MNTIGKTLIIVGIILTILGVVFSLQSKSVIGPSSSIMYDNPEWTVNGSIIIDAGLIMVGVGLIVVFIKRKNKILPK
jgi:uncharacterized membrane protein